MRYYLHTSLHCFLQNKDPYSVKNNGDLCGDNSAYTKQKVLKVLCYETDLAKLEKSIKTITSSISRSVKITDGDSIKLVTVVYDFRVLMPLN